MTATDDRCDDADEHDVVIGNSPPLNVVLKDNKEPWKGPFDMPATEEDAALEFKPVTISKPVK